MMMITYNILLILMYTFFYSNTFCVPSRVWYTLVSFLFMIRMMNFDIWGIFFTRGVSYIHHVFQTSDQGGEEIDGLHFIARIEVTVYKSWIVKLENSFLSIWKVTFFFTKMYKRMEIFFLVPRRDSQIHTYRPIAY